jgi:FkbM family methyltransferase
MANRLVRAGLMALYRRGFSVHRNAATRRQQVMSDAGVDLVLDVGAASGAFGRELREWGYSGRIVSFEPMAAAFQRLEETRGDDPRWEVRRTALGDKAERAEINVATNSDSSSLLPLADAHREAAPWVTYGGTETIDVTRLDDIADQLLPPGTRAFLKIDTQGFERQVLDGAATALGSCVMVQLELSFAPLYEGSMLVDEAVSRMYAEGFRLVALDQGLADSHGRILQADGVFVRS